MMPCLASARQLSQLSSKDMQLLPADAAVTTWQCWSEAWWWQEWCRAPRTLRSRSALFYC